MTLLVIGNAVIDVTDRLERLPRSGETILAAGREAEENAIISAATARLVP